MANQVKYNNQIWGEPIAGERLSTNGHYTGEHLGSVTQDAKAEKNEAHSVENATVRLGTMTHDAIEGSMPTEVEEG